jgi:hypothetical protein
LQKQKHTLTKNGKQNSALKTHLGFWVPGSVSGYTNFLVNWAYIQARSESLREGGSEGVGCRR